MSFEPLDPAEYKRQMLILKILHTAHPVLVDGKVARVHSFHAGPNGGRIEMQVYLAGKSEPVRVDEITLQPQPQ